MNSVILQVLFCLCCSLGPSLFSGVYFGKWSLCFFFFGKEVKSVFLDWSAICCFVSSFYGVFLCVFIAYHLSLSFSYGGVLPLSIREHCPWWLFCCVGMRCIMCNSFCEHCPWSDGPDLDRNILLPRGIWFLVVFFIFCSFVARVSGGQLPFSSIWDIFCVWCCKC